jgi:hypothetical protein
MAGHVTAPRPCAKAACVCMQGMRHTLACLCTAICWRAGDCRAEYKQLADALQAQPAKAWLQRTVQRQLLRAGLTLVSWLPL